MPIDVVATVGPQVDAGEVGPQPHNVLVERHLDQHSLLPHCDLVVSHGGSGTVCGALADGLAMILLPIGADQLFNGRRCRSLGAAWLLDTVGTTPAEVRGAAASLLGRQPSTRGRNCRDEIAALPAQESAVALLVSPASRKAWPPA